MDRQGLWLKSAGGTMNSTMDGKMEATQSSSTAPKWNHRTRSLVLKVTMVVVAVAWLSLIAASWADAAEATPGRISDEETSATTDAASAHAGPSYDTTAFRGNRSPSGTAGANSPVSSEDDYNFNWLDPEKKIYVLQNRRYAKDNRLMISGMFGPGFSNPYRTTYNLDPRVAYYFSEAWGIEGFFRFTINAENSTYQALKIASPNTLPGVREFRSEVGALLNWVPWYAKINVFNKIIYFDWYFSGGAGNVRAQIDKRTTSASVPVYVDQSLFAAYLGTGHMYHLSQNFLVRLDFTSAIYNAPVGGDTGDNAWFSNYNFAIGFGVKL